MSDLIRKVSFPFVLLIFLSLQASVILEAGNKDKELQKMKPQATSKSRELTLNYGKIPLYFTPNEGQVNEKALFYTKTPRYTLWLTREGLVFDSIKRLEKKNYESYLKHSKERFGPINPAYDRNVSSIIFLNSNKNPDIVPVNQAEHKVNYFIGNDKSKWRTNIQTSRAVLYQELFRNIDLKVYGIESQIEYEFIVKPNGDVSDILFEYEGVEKTKIGKDGNLIISTKFGQLQHAKPVCYQVIGGVYVEVGAEFKELRENTYGFHVNKYDENYELVIDPLILVYSTYLGGSKYDIGHAIAVDSEGAAYITGSTSSVDFPLQNPIQQNIKGTGYDCFVTKLDPTGTTLIYSTYLGGSDLWDFGRGIAVDSQGAVYVTGSTESTDFPTQNPIQSKLAGTFGLSDAFITKIDSSGSVLVYSTYLGGSHGDGGMSIDVDAEGAAYIAGSAYSRDFPTQNPFQGINAGATDVFITKINASGTAIDYSTFIGGSGAEWCNYMTLDSEGAAYVTGETTSNNFPVHNPVQGNYSGSTDCFIAKLSSSGTALAYSTYLGGSGHDEGAGIDVDRAGAACIAGYTYSINFPLQNPLQGSYGGSSDAFVCRLSPSGSQLVFSTFFGGGGQDGGHGIAVDSQGSIYVTGRTESFDFPLKNSIKQNITGYRDGFVTKLNPDGINLRYSTYLGGNGFDLGNDIEVDAEGAAYVIGETNSSDFPLQNPFQGSNSGLDDVFITKLCFSCSLTISAGIGGTTDPSPGIHTYCEGSQVTMTAIPNKGYKFSGWSGDASGEDNPIAITLDSDKSVTANFEREIISYTLSIESGSGGTTNPSPGIYSYEEGTEVTITAIPDTHFRFSHWSGDISSSDNPITIIMDSDKSVKANFFRQYTLNIATGMGGTTNPRPGSYIYDKGTEITITAIPDAHYRFSSWSGDRSGLINPITIRMNSDKSVIASFIRIIYSPLNFTGQKVLNRSLSQAEYINVFSWQSNPNNVNIMKYRIYMVEGEIKNLLVELNVSTFEYWHRRVEEDKLYTYAICAVNNDNREGDPTHITVR